MKGKVLQLESERLIELGETRGKAIGKAEGETRMRTLLSRLISDGRMEEIPKVAGNADICKKLYKEYGL